MSLPCAFLPCYNPAIGADQEYEYLHTSASVKRVYGKLADVRLMEPTLEPVGDAA